MDPTHRFTFHRIGGLVQVAIEHGADIANLHQLDQKLWVALSCPVRGLEMEARTLEFIDTDKDGRVRAPDLLAAIEWCKPRLKSLDALIPAGGPLQLSSIDGAKPEGKAVLAAAERILSYLGKKGAAEILVPEAQDISRVFAGTRFNGDGVVIPASADDPAVASAISDAISAVGPTPDRSGEPGLDKAHLELFFADLAAYAEWTKRPFDQPFGAATADVYAAVAEVEAKVTEYFTRARLAAYDPALVAKDLEGAELAKLPLAKPEPGRALPLDQGSNPAWAARLAALSRAVNATSLMEAQWFALKDKLAPYAAHLATKVGASVEKLGLPRIEQLLSSNAKQQIEQLIAQDEAVAPEWNALADVEKLARFRRDLHTLTRNFVNFADFYDPRLAAVFQSGTLYLDSRSCDLCVKVDDPGAHVALASLSRMYIAYCDCKRPGESMKIAACFTQGGSDYLMPGRNGLFYDRQGRDWDATISKIVDNPISIRQAFLSPYKKFTRLIEEQALKFAASKEKENDARLATSAEKGVPPPVDVGKMVGIIAALGVGIGAVSTVFGGLVAGFVGLQPWWAKLVAVLCVPLAISGPSMLLAFLKLRQRTLGPVLDGNGWAINGRVMVNLPLGTALTEIPSLPPGSRRSLEDPFEDKKARARRRLIWAALILGVAVWVALQYWRR
jgi:hypothetical protein